MILGREKFVEETWKWKEEYADHIRAQWAKFGLGLDYSRERFTLDEGLSKAVKKCLSSFMKKALFTVANILLTGIPQQKRLCPILK